MGSPSFLAPSSSSDYMGVPLTVSSSLKSQLPLTVLSRTSSVVILVAKIKRGVRLSRQLTKVKWQREVARRDLATAMFCFMRARDENDDLQSVLASPQDAFQMFFSSILGLESKCDAVFAQLSPTDDIDDDMSWSSFVSPPVMSLSLSVVDGRNSFADR